MNQLCTQLVGGLFRSGVVLTISALVMMLLMRRYPITSSRLRRLVYFAVILQGCLLLKLPSELYSVQIFKPAPVQQRSFDDDRTEQIRALAFDIAEAMFAGNLATRPAAVASPIKRQFPWMMTFAAVWIAGLLTLVGRSVWHYVWFLEEVTRRTRPSAGWDQEWKGLQRRYRSKHRVTFKLCEGVGPLICFHPGGYQLIVPSEVWGMLEPRQRMMILRHELAHLQRCDLWKSLAIRLLALVHWFNPLVWKLVRRFDEDAECACDDAVRIADSTSAIDYARTLLLLGGPHGSISLATQAASEPGLADRIRRMIVPAPMKDSQMKKYMIAAVVLAISALQLLRLELKAHEPSALAPGNEVSSVSVDTITIQGKSEVIGSNEQGQTSSIVGNTIGVASSDDIQPVIDVRFVLNNLEEYEHAVQKFKQENQSQEERLREQVRNAAGDDEDAKSDELKRLMQRQANETLNKHVNLSMSLYQKIMNQAAVYTQEQHLSAVRAKKRSKHAISTLSAVDRGQLVWNVGAPQTGIVYASTSGGVVAAGGGAIGIQNGTNSIHDSNNSNVTVAFSDNSSSTVTLANNASFGGIAVSPLPQRRQEKQGITFTNEEGKDVTVNFLNVGDTSNSVLSVTANNSPAQYAIGGDAVLTTGDGSQQKPFTTYNLIAASVDLAASGRGIFVANEVSVVSTPTAIDLALPQSVENGPVLLVDQAEEVGAVRKYYSKLSFVGSGAEHRQSSPHFHAWFGLPLDSTNRTDNEIPGRVKELDISWEIIKRLNIQFEKAQGEKTQTKESSPK